ncbi:MAG: hypothetical protein IKO44_04980 [Ruminococcus sp.]|nr:hypothetical protein [Ruminococcus sp.]
MSRKRKRPPEAIFDDEKDLELERMGLDSGTASATEMTGIVPNGWDLTDSEYEEQKDLFPFGLPNRLQ